MTTDERSLAEKAERLKKRVERDAIPWIERRTVAIFRVPESGVPSPNCTGVLLQVAEHHFIVTAAHALDLWREQALVVPTGDGTGINLTASRAEVTRDQRYADFALIPLSIEMVAALPSTKQFARLNELDVTGEEPAPGIHAVFGYPLELAKRDVASLTCDAIYYPTSLYKVPDTDPGISIGLEIHPEIEDSDGARARLPDLHGISGCGIWRVHRKGDDVDTWSVDRIRLVGIEHTVCERKWILGARIRHIAAGIASQFPELERSVGLIGIALVKPPAPTPDAPV